MVIVNELSYDSFSSCVIPRRKCLYGGVVFDIHICKDGESDKHSCKSKEPENRETRVVTCLVLVLESPSHEYR